jgi:hypothetical protein
MLLDIKLLLSDDYKEILKRKTDLNKEYLDILTEYVDNELQKERRGAKSIFNTREKIVMTIKHLKENNTYQKTADDFGIQRSWAFKIIKKISIILNKRAIEIISAEQKEKTEEINLIKKKPQTTLII